MGGPGFRNPSNYQGGKNPCTAFYELKQSKPKRFKVVADKRPHFYVWRNEGITPHEYPSQNELRNLERLLLNYVVVNKDKINRIDGGRYEVYVPSPGQVEISEHVGTFLRLASKTLKDEVSKYVEWANTTARERVLLNLSEIGDMASGFMFGNHSFLISFLKIILLILY